MKKIRTILAYYNGEKFIDEQLQSIVDQEIPEGYEHEIYVYDDGSKKESHDFLISKWAKIKSVKVIGFEKNKGTYFTYYSGMISAIKDGVDIIFLSDQDDIFAKNKYLTHLNEHKSGNKYVLSYSQKWNPFNNSLSETTLKSWSGHRASIDLSIFRDDKNFDVKRFEKYIDEHYADFFPKNCYHDMSIAYILCMKTKPKFISDSLTKWRINQQSLTSTSNVSKELKKSWANKYDFFFKEIRNLYKSIFGEAPSISKFNMVQVYFDNYPKICMIKAFFDTIAMHLRLKFFRNLVDNLQIVLEK